MYPRKLARWQFKSRPIATGYHCFAQRKGCCTHGGLITYIDASMNSSVIDIKNKSAIWESLFVSIKGSVHNKDITLGNIYRPPKDNNIRINIDYVTNDLDPILVRICEENSDSVIVGDFNINLSKINMCNFEHFEEFLDLMLGYSLFPRITLSTRSTKHSCTLIDNALCKLSTDLKNVKAGIMLSEISDHYIRGEIGPM